MKILAIETSCDETAAAVVSKNPKENYVKVLSNVVASSLIYHSETGGIIPNIAAREQLKFIIPVIKKAIENSLPTEEGKFKIKNLDAIAVTYGPGLIGSLLIGVETAKTLAFLWKKPIISVNHLLGHIYANFIGEKSKIEFPTIVLLVSGGHTDLLLMKNHNNFKWLGGTRDDAAGEAFDKIGRLLNLPYPAGPVMEALAKKGNPKAFTFPRPMIGSKDFNFSFSGLKAAVWREVNKLKRGVAPEEGLPTARTVKGALAGGKLATGPQLKGQVIADICACVQKSIIEVLVRKTMKAAKKYNVKTVLLGGGVSANQSLRNTLEVSSQELGVKFFAPAKNLCTDNAAMIGAYACFHPKKSNWKELTADPELYFK